MKIISLSQSKDRKKFIGDFSTLPEICRQPADQTGIFPAAIWQMFLNLPYPSPKEFWIATDVNGKAVGRIGANLSTTYSGLGYFGFFEVDYTSREQAHQIGLALLEQAQNWCRSHGVQKFAGPMNLNTWFPYRFRIDDGSALRFDWEPCNPLIYPEIIAEFGAKPEDQYHSQAYDQIDQVIEKTQSSFDRCLHLGFKIERLTPEELMESLPDFYQISIQAFKENALFEPIDFKSFSQLYTAVASRPKPSFIYLLRDPSNRPQGFLFSFVDDWCEPNGKARKALVHKSVALAPQARGQGLSNALMHLSYVEAQNELQIDSVISALVRTGIQSQSYAKKGNLLWEHHYGLWSKDLSALDR